MTIVAKDIVAKTELSVCYSLATDSETLPITQMHV